MKWWINKWRRGANPPLLFLRTSVSPHTLPPSFFSLPLSLFSWERLGIILYLTILSREVVKVNAHWRTALEQRRAHESWRLIGHIQKTTFAVGDDRLADYSCKLKERRRIFLEKRRVRTGDVTFCQTGWLCYVISTEKQLENSFIAALLLPTACALPTTLPTRRFLVPNIYRKFPRNSFGPCLVPWW